MKRVGFRPTYAGGVEACALNRWCADAHRSWGSTAFVMATYLEIPYAEIVLAASHPGQSSIISVCSCRSTPIHARFHLKGLPISELPRALDVLKSGWYFIFVFAWLIYMLMHMQREAQAPYYATALLLDDQSGLGPTLRWNLRKLMDFLVGIGKLFTELAAILAGIGLIIGALTLSR